MPEDRASDEHSDPPLEERLKEIEDDATAKIADVRQRIVQMKMEIDEKAPVDHDHEALETRIDAVETAVEGLETVDPATVDRLEDAVERQAEAIEDLEGALEDVREKAGMLAASSVEVRDRVDGMEALEATLESHGEALDGVEEKVEMVASSTLDLHDRLEELTDRDRDGLRRLRTAANRERVRRARCGACGSRLDVGLLHDPSCPDCDAAFVDVESRGFLRRGRLVTEATGGDSDASSADAVPTDPPDEGSLFPDDATGGPRDRTS